MLSALTVTTPHIRMGTYQKIDGVRIDTAEKRRSIMRRQQYEAYKTELGLHFPIQASASRRLNGIGRSGTILGSAKK